MIDFVPIKYYADIYYYSILLICLITFGHTIILNFNEIKTLNFNRVLALFLCVGVIIYIGFRPINGVFIDMTTYSHIFERYKNGVYEINSDYGFSYFILFCTEVMTVEWFFFLSACIYIIPLYIACKNWFPRYYFFAFLMFIGSFSFWAYGVNGIRNGMATSLFILAISYTGRNHFLMLFYFLISFSFHNSMLLPIVAFAITYYVTDTNKYIFFYILAIALSITMGGIWENIFASIGFGDDRFSTYLTTDADANKFASVGFRYDFLIYSVAPILLALHYKFKNGFKDIIFDRLLHTYIIANGFWIMIIRANFSNRFAYLSWFMMAVIVIYPLLKENLWVNQFKKLGYVVLIYFGFTFAMFLYYSIR